MKTNRLLIFMLVATSVLLYFNTLNHGYVLDDFSVIKENFVVKQGVEGIPTIWETHYRYGYGFQKAELYRPLSLSLFALEWELAPDQPEFAHGVNIFLYSLLGVLIFLLLLHLFGKEKKLIAFLASLLFIAHPIHTEVVANIKSVDDLLVFNLVIGAYLLLLKHLKSKNYLLLVLSLTMVGLAYFAKESAFTLVLCIPLILIIIKKVESKKALLISSLYLIPTAFYFTVRTNILGALRDPDISSLDNVLVGAPNLIVKWATALKIMGLYLYKLIYPHPLINDYSFNHIELNGLDNLFTWISIIVYGLFLWLAINWWNKKPIISFGIWFFLINLSLYTNLFITIGTSFGERLLFIPSLGLTICMAAVLVHFLATKSDKTSLSKQPKLLLVSGIILSLYAFKTVERNKDWKDNLTLYSSDVEKCENSARCQYHYGISTMKDLAMTAKNERDKVNYLNTAISAFQKAITIYPNYSEAYADLGLAYFRLNNFTAAEKNYIKATALNPANATAFSNLGSLYFNTQRYAEAKKAYERTLQLNPNHIDGLANYASTLGTLGDFNGAITYFKKAIKLNPNEANYYQMVGITYQNLGKMKEANQYFSKAKTLRGK